MKEAWKVQLNAKTRELEGRQLSALQQRQTNRQLNNIRKEIEKLAWKKKKALVFIGLFAGFLVLDRNWLGLNYKTVAVSALVYGWKRLRRGH